MSSEPLATCQQCQLSSPLTDAFRPMRTGRGRLLLCPACIADEGRRSGALTLVGFGFALGLGLLVVALGGKSNAGWLLLNLAFLHVVSWLKVILHEAGHALVARLLRLDVYRVVIGTGPLLFRVTAHGVPVDFHALPLGGLTYTDIRDEPGARIKRILVVAAGPAVDLALLWAAVHFLGQQAIAEKFGGGFAPVTTFIVACVLGLVTNLLPLRVRSSAGLAATDGAQLLLLLFIRRVPFDQLARAVVVERAQLLISDRQYAAAEAFVRSTLQRYPNDPYLLVALSAAIINLHRYDEGRAVLLELLKQTPLDARVEAVAFNNLAWANLHLDDPGLIDDARAMSAAAYLRLPWETYVLSTHGCVEALHGDPDQACVTLQRALAKLRFKDSRGSAKAALAMAHARLGRTQESAAALAEAQAIDPDGLLLRKVRKRLAAEALGAQVRAP